MSKIKSETKMEDASFNSLQEYATTCFKTALTVLLAVLLFSTVVCVLTENFKSIMQALMHIWTFLILIFSYKGNFWVTAATAVLAEFTAIWLAICMGTIPSTIKEKALKSTFERRLIKISPVVIVFLIFIWVANAIALNHAYTGVADTTTYHLVALILVWVPIVAVVAGLVIISILAI